MTADILEAVTEAKAIAWDTCHKIYVLMDNEQVESMIGYGYKDDMFTKDELTTEQMMDNLEDWYANSCGLRFIQAVRTVVGDPNNGFITLVEQGEDWER